MQTKRQTSIILYVPLSSNKDECLIVLAYSPQETTLFASHTPNVLFLDVDCGREILDLLV